MLLVLDDFWCGNNPLPTLWNWVQNPLAPNWSSVLVMLSPLNVVRGTLFDSGEECLFLGWPFLREWRIWKHFVWVAFLCFVQECKTSCHAVSQFWGPKTAQLLLTTLQSSLLVFSYAISRFYSHGSMGGERKTTFFSDQKSSFLFDNVFCTTCLELRLNLPVCKHDFLHFENQDCVCLFPDFSPFLIIHNSVYIAVLKLSPRSSQYPGMWYSKTNTS